MSPTTTVRWLQQGGLWSQDIEELGRIEVQVYSYHFYLTPRICRTSSNVVHRAIFSGSQQPNPRKGGLGWGRAKWYVIVTASYGMLFSHFAYVLEHQLPIFLASAGVWLETNLSLFFLETSSSAGAS